MRRCSCNAFSTALHHHTRFSESAAFPYLVCLSIPCIAPFHPLCPVPTLRCRLSCGQSLLLDCGEEALGALCRMYGTAAALRHVASLGCLWVSHRHAGGQLVRVMHSRFLLRATLLAWQGTWMAEVLG